MQSIWFAGTIFSTNVHSTPPDLFLSARPEFLERGEFFKQKFPGGDLWVRSWSRSSGCVFDIFGQWWPGTNMNVSARVGWALRTGRVASVPACPSAWRPLGPNPSYRDLLSPLHYTWNEGSFLTSSGPWRSQLRRQRSQDQAHGTTARAEQRQRGACFPSMINAVRSSADVRKTSRTRGILLGGQHQRDARTAQAFKEQRASVFASSLDTTQVHCKPSRTSRLLLHEQPHRRSDVRTSDALTDWNQNRCVSLGLCARSVWLILFALQICDICRSDRRLVLRVTCVESRIYILYHRCRVQHLSLYVRTCDYLSYIYTVLLYSYNGSSSYMIYLQSVCNLFVKRAVRETAGLSV